MEKVEMRIGPVGRAPGGGGFITLGTLLVAALSALMLMSVCHALPTNFAFARQAIRPPTAAPDAHAVFVPLQPFDEHFHTPDAESLVQVDPA